MAEFINQHVERLSHTADDHKIVYRYFNNCGVEDVEAIASNLNDLREDRNESDYKLRSDRFKNENVASLLFMKASTAFNSFESIVQSSKQRKRVVEGIRKHRETTNS